MYVDCVYLSMIFGVLKKIYVGILSSDMGYKQKWKFCKLVAPVFS